MRRKEHATNATSANYSSLRFRLVLYLGVLAAIAMLWGYLLFMRPPRKRRRVAEKSGARTGKGASG